MHTHRFGRKLKLPSTIAIKHQIRKLMFEDAVKQAEVKAEAEAFRGQPGKELLVNADATRRCEAVDLRFRDYGHRRLDNHDLWPGVCTENLVRIDFPANSRSRPIIPCSGPGELSHNIIQK